VELAYWSGVGNIKLVLSWRDLPGFHGFAVNLNFSS
jgi:hypothetical protein